MMARPVGTTETRLNSSLRIRRWRVCVLEYRESVCSIKTNRLGPLDTLDLSKQ